MKSKENISVEELQSMVRELNYLHKVSQRISEKNEIEDLLCEIMESCKEVTGAEASSLMIFDEEENNLYFEIALGKSADVVKKITVKIGEGIAGWVAQKREPLIIHDCYADPRFNPDFDRQSGFKTRDMICVPMLKQDKLIGVIQVINKKGGTVFSERDLNLFQTLASQCAISIENARLMEVQIRQKAFERELETARKIQENLLPAKLPEIKNAEVTFGLKSAKEVGGDYYNVYKINDDLALFFICDVSGKSISAALIVSTICACILTLLKRKDYSFSLEDFVCSLNKVLVESTTDEKFATAWFGLLDTKGNKLTSINAGHNTTFVFRNGELYKELNEGGIFLGLSEYEYKVETLRLMSGDLLVCFTDGVSEAMNQNGEFYGEDRLKECVLNNITETTAKILNDIFMSVQSFAGDAEQSDDITCGVIRII